MNGSKSLIAKRILICLISFLFAVIYVFPNAALMLGLILTAYNKYTSMFFLLIFTYNISRLVESGYKKYLEKKK